MQVKIHTGHKKIISANLGTQGRFYDNLAVLIIVLSVVSARRNKGPVQV